MTKIIINYFHFNHYNKYISKLMFFLEKKVLDFKIKHTMNVGICVTSRTGAVKTLKY